MNVRTHPDIESTLHQHKRQASLGVSQANPHLAVHEQAMVHVDHPLPLAVRSRIYTVIFFTLAPCQPVQAQEVAIFGLQDMLLGGVAVQAAKVDKVGAVPDGCGRG